ncbi:uncharacterized protein LOC131231439 isoform X3 [Magnolia sinica]|uniref:uncharacterized protein LOC131231439 isoform X3 n=1 Tax=Magnolia sinica TaxID=86752 RepID=UPI00265AA602|nr:uncharacterized protein LOC131231439 isoform X3 [Magnolia sinica]
MPVLILSMKESKQKNRPAIVFLHSSHKMKEWVRPLLEAWAVAGSSEGIANHFYELVPDMALDFPFELDKFQKEERGIQRSLLRNNLLPKSLREK